jgi:hypothetical protein
MNQLQDSQAKQDKYLTKELSSSTDSAQSKVKSEEPDGENHTG